MFLTRSPCHEIIHSISYSLKFETSRLANFTFLSCVMPSAFIRNVFPRRLRHRDGEETVTSQAAGQASDKATSCALQDPPPPYASGNLALIDDDKALLLSSPLIQPSTPPVFTQPESKLSARDSIQFCPHADSSFERIQRIVRLPNFKQSYEGLDALTPGPDHRNPFASGFRLCKPDTGSDLCISELSFPSRFLAYPTAF